MKPYRIARVVTNELSPPNYDIPARLNLINGAINELKEPVDVIQTAGGFLWVKTDFTNCPLGEDSSEENFSIITKIAEELVHDDVEVLHKKMANKVDYITLGVDVLTWDEKSAGAELVGTYDVAAGCFVKWTGKSYPTSDQAKTLLYCLDMASHVQILNRRRVLVIGCHDLNMFSPRSFTNINKGSGETYKAWAVSNFRDVVADFKPEILLHHPHSTVSIKTWCTAYSGVNKLLPNLEAYSSGIHYYDPWKSAEQYSGLERVLHSTKKGTVLDILCTGKDCRVVY